MQRAIQEARKIRKYLLRKTSWRILDLAGSCGLASILLTIALNDVSILRYGSLSLGGGHVWTQINNTIVDITASQFNKSWTGVEDETVRGVLVSNTPRYFHLAPELFGSEVYLMVVNKGWYTTKHHPRWRWISEYWL